MLDGLDRARRTLRQPTVPAASERGVGSVGICGEHGHQQFARNLVEERRFRVAHRDDGRVSAEPMPAGAPQWVGSPFMHHCSDPLDASRAGGM